MAWRQGRAVRGPQRVERRDLAALGGPAEFGNVSTRRTERRQEPDRRRILGERLPLLESSRSSICAPLRLIDPTGWRPDADPRRSRQRAPRRSESPWRGGSRRLGTRLRQRLLLAIDDLAARRVRCREISVRSPSSSRAARAHSAPPRGSNSCCRSLLVVPHGTGSEPWPPQGWQRQIRFRAIQPPRAAP